MSASLVGSEMCIRDSVDPGPALMAACFRGHRDIPRAALHFRPQVAVSYTHLTLPTICSV
eukprot:11471388-Alexandrium_andersonii.AAC.1